MGKHYKKGNRGKKRKYNPNKDYMNRERQINKLVNEFKRYVLYEPYNIKNYKYANNLRNKIKDLLYAQGNFIYDKGSRRRWIYYEQTSQFKGLYVYWKKQTLHLYLKVKFHFPDHIIPVLCVFYRDVKKGCVLNFNIFF